MITFVCLAGVAMLILGVVFLVLGGFEGIGMIGIGAIALGVGRALDKLDQQNDRISFIIKKMGWEEEEMASGYLTPEQQAKLEKKKEQREILKAVSQKHPEELTQEQLGSLIEEERRSQSGVKSGENPV